MTKTTKIIWGILAAGLTPLAAHADHSADVWPGDANIGAAMIQPSPVPSAEKQEKHMVLFRGGYAHNSGVSNRSDIVSLGAGGGLGGTTEEETENTTFYLGSGIDLNLSSNSWGLLNETPLNKTSTLAELLFEYRNFDHVNTGVTPALSMVGGSESIDESEMIFSVAPKVKFRDGDAFRPWLIPAGFAVHVLNTDGTSHMTPGVMFGGGADYNLWKNVFVGLDARLHLNNSDSKRIPDDGFSAGGYVGIGF